MRLSRTTALTRVNGGTGHLPPFVQTLDRYQPWRSGADRDHLLGSPARIALAGTDADWRGRTPLRPVSTFLRPFAPDRLPVLHRYYERSDFCSAGSLAHVSMNASPSPEQISQLHVHGRLDHSVANHLTPHRRRFVTLPLSATAALCSQSRTSSFTSRLVGAVRPNRVRHPTDWSFTSGCSPPRLAATQLPLVTGRRAHAWGGLAPPCPCTLAGALVQAFRPARHGGPQGPHHEY